MLHCGQARCPSTGEWIKHQRWLGENVWPEWSLPRAFNPRSRYPLPGDQFSINRILLTPAPVRSTA